MSKTRHESGPETTVELIAVLEQEVRLRKENLRIVRLGSAALVVGLFALWGYLGFTQGTTLGEFLSNYGAFFLVALGGVALTAKHRQALLQTRQPDSRLTGFLIEALHYKDAAVVRHSETVLTNQLPHVTDLTPHHAELLAAHLAKSKNRAFVKSALIALRRFGSASCLQELDDLSKRNPFTVLALEATAEIRLRSARQMIEREEAKLRTGP